MKKTSKATLKIPSTNNEQHSLTNKEWANNESAFSYFQEVKYLEKIEIGTANFKNHKL